eukprot:944656_1
MKRKRNDEEPADNSSTTDHFRQVHNRAAADERARARRLRLDALASEARAREARLVKVRARTSQVQEANDAELARKLAEQWEEEDRQRTTNLLESDSQFAKQCDATLKAVLLSTAGSGPNKENIANSAANNNESVSSSYRLNMPPLERVPQISKKSKLSPPGKSNNIPASSNSSSDSHRYSSPSQSSSGANEHVSSQMPRSSSGANEPMFNRPGRVGLPSNFRSHVDRNLSGVNHHMSSQMPSSSQMPGSSLGSRIWSGTSHRFDRKPDIQPDSFMGVSHSQSHSIDRDTIMSFPNSPSSGINSYSGGGIGVNRSPYSGALFSPSHSFRSSSNGNGSIGSGVNSNSMFSSSGVGHSSSSSQYPSLSLNQILSSSANQPSSSPNDVVVGTPVGHWDSDPSEPYDYDSIKSLVMDMMDSPRSRMPSRPLSSSMSSLADSVSQRLMSMSGRVSGSQMDPFGSIPARVMPYSRGASNFIDLTADSPTSSSRLFEHSVSSSREHSVSSSREYNVSSLNLGSPFVSNGNFGFEQSSSSGGPGRFGRSRASSLDLDNSAPPVSANDLAEQVLEGLGHQDDLKELETPRGMTIQLYKHQKLGLDWMVKKELSDQRGGILADEMGLGKTIQSIGLMTARPSPDRARRTTLIIGPLALVRQWADEIASFTQPALTTYIYHGQNRIKDPRKLVKFDVVITSYSIIAAEYPKRPPGTAQKLGPILKTKFYRIILDECQEIKNRATRSSQGCAQLLGKFRWCLSGTPIQNSLDDVFSLFRFLKLPHWSAWKNFKVLSAGVKGNRPAAAWVRVRNVMRSVMLRRTKSQVDIRLPSREINLVELKMSDEEMDIYKSIETKAQTKFSKYFQEGSVRRNYMNVLKMLNDLRQACNHPWLNVDFKRTFAQLSSPFDPSAAVSSSSSSSSSSCCSSSSSSAVVVSPARPNIVPNASHLELLVEMGFGQNQSSHALVAVENQSLDLAIDWLVAHMHDAAISLPLVRVADIMEHFAEEVVRRLRDERVLDSEDLECDICMDVWDEPMVLRCGHVYCRPHLLEMSNCPSCRQPFTLDEAVTLEDARESPRIKPPQSVSSSPAAVSINPVAPAVDRLAMHPEWRSSAKIDRLVQILCDIRRNKPDSKVLLFSQWTRMLDLVEIPLKSERFEYRRYDGKLSRKQREAVIEEMREDPKVKILLMSLRCGSLGLNLTFCDTVVILDPWWNPAVENQAIDRVHRLGSADRCQSTAS